ncbi:MAG TPA: DUF6069 family protein [Acidimicrobiales bacterium]|nr:DUF6069 family protein [Acidimicrobiales bacterium]
MATKLTHTATALARPAVHSRRAVAVAAAVGAALACWTIAEGVFGVDVHAPGFGGEPPKDVGAGDVALSAAVAGLAGWALLALLERITDRAARLWSAAAFAVVVLSLGGPFGAGIDTASRVVLVCLHLLVAAVLIRVFRTTTAARKRHG